MIPAPLLLVGDALLDVDLDGRVERLCPDAPVPVVDQTARRARPGGAGLAALLAAAEGREVTLVTALSADDAGREVAELLRSGGVQVIDLGLDAPTPEKVRVRSDGRSLVRLDRGGGGRAAIGPVTAEARRAIAAAPAVLVSDYGRGMAAKRGVRDAVAEAAARDARVIWDPHPRGEAPVPGIALATPNDDEARRLVPQLEGDDGGHALARAAAVAARWDTGAVAVTRGALGASLAGPAVQSTTVGAPVVEGGDPCGAGDRFASAAAGALADGSSLIDSVRAGVAQASTFVAAGGATAVAVTAPPATEPRPAQRQGGSTPRRSTDPQPVAAEDRLPAAQRLIEDVRARGGTAVATGGCFDLLHAGHVQTLRRARALGDCLVVCLNSDASVRRLKGLDRPLVCEADRASVIEALACVDAVVVFEEDTPQATLERLRPDVWAKGGDYAEADLPEAATLRRWGGRVELLPFMAGRSTSQLIEEARLRALA